MVETTAKHLRDTSCVGRMVTPKTYVKREPVDVNLLGKSVFEDVIKDLR